VQKPAHSAGSTFTTKKRKEKIILLLIILQKIRPFVVRKKNSRAKAPSRKEYKQHKGKIILPSIILPKIRG
jgi:hypothetical protein